MIPNLLPNTCRHCNCPTLKFIVSCPCECHDKMNELLAMVGGDRQKLKQIIESIIYRIKTDADFRAEYLKKKQEIDLDKMLRDLYK